MIKLLDAMMDQFLNLLDEWEEMPGLLKVALYCKFTITNEPNHTEWNGTEHDANRVSGQNHCVQSSIDVCFKEWS